MTLNDTENEMQPTTSALDLKGLFDAPSKNIKLAFEHVIELITQQSREIDNLKQAQHEATKANEELRSQIEIYADELAKERTGTAAELQKLRKDCHDLLTLHQQSEATVGILQQEIKVGAMTCAGGCSHARIHSYIHKYFSRTCNSISMVPATQFKILQMTEDVSIHLCLSPTLVERRSYHLI
jgi:hypothetical protein